jgi:hypothetical protein
MSKDMTHDLHSNGGGDTEPEILFMHAYDYKLWRIAQTIEKLGFSLYFGFNLYELLV